MTDLTLRNIKKSFGKVRVIHGIDLEVEDGEFIVIVGPSGCGKSTLLRMVAGLENVTDGDILIDNIKVRYSKSSKYVNCALNYAENFS